MFNKAKKILICLINTINWRVIFDKPYKNGDIFKYNQKSIKRLSVFKSSLHHYRNIIKPIKIFHFTKFTFVKCLLVKNL